MPGAGYIAAFHGFFGGNAQCQHRSRRLQTYDLQLPPKGDCERARYYCSGSQPQPAKCGKASNYMAENQEKNQAAGRPQLNDQSWYQILVNTKVPLVPPNPKELERATSIFMGLATLGT